MGEKWYRMCLTDPQRLVDLNIPDIVNSLSQVLASGRYPLERSNSYTLALASVCWWSVIRLFKDVLTLTSTRVLILVLSCSSS